MLSNFILRLQLLLFQPCFPLCPFFSCISAVLSDQTLMQSCRMGAQLSALFADVYLSRARWPILRLRVARHTFLVGGLAGIRHAQDMHISGIPDLSLFPLLSLLPPPTAAAATVQRKRLFPSSFLPLFSATFPRSLPPPPLPSPKLLSVFAKLSFLRRCRRRYCSTYP